MFRKNKEENTYNNEDSDIERIEETLKCMWELITTLSDDIFEIKKKLGLEAELHKGRRSDLGISNLIKIAIKQYPMLHPCSIFDEISSYVAFSDGIDTTIYSKFKLPDGGTDVFEDKDKSKLLDDWINKNKEYWIRQIKMHMAKIYGWKLFDSLKESAVKVSDNNSKIYDLVLRSPEFKNFKYKMDTQEIVYFGVMSLGEKEQCIKLSTNEVDKKYVEELYKKSQTAKDVH